MTEDKRETKTSFTPQEIEDFQSYQVYDFESDLQFQQGIENVPQEQLENAKWFYYNK